MKTTEAQTISKDDLERSVCLDSFYAFVQRFWDVVVPEDPVWNWHIKYICDEMQKIAERVFQNKPKKHDLVFNVPPGSTKTIVCSIMFPAWVWTRMPTARTICSSYANDLSLEISRKCRLVIQSEKYQRLFGVRIIRDQNTKGHYVNEEGGERYCTSTDGTVTGFHAHFIIVDDPLNPREATSDADLANANHHITETLSQRKIDKAVTPTILIMQRLHEGDPTGEMLSRAEESRLESEKTGKERAIRVKHVCLPGEIDDMTKRNVRPRSLHRKYKKVEGYEYRLLDPVRLGPEVLEAARIELGIFGYAGQIEQGPVPRGGGMFRTDRIVIEPVMPTRANFIQLVRFWDKAGTKGGGAYTVGTLMGEDRSHVFWVLDVVRAQLDSGAREATIKQTAEVDGRDVIIGVEQEPGSGGKESAESTARNLRGFRVQIVRPTGDKTTRADPFSSQVNAYNVRIVKGEWNRAWLDEHRIFPNSKFKDQVDSSSGGFTVLTGPRGRIGTWGRRKRRTA